MPPRRPCHAHPEPARGFTARLARLRPAGKFRQHPQRFHHAALAHRCAADGTETVFAMDDAAIARGGREEGIAATASATIRLPWGV